jgi:hypothetical protein
MGRFSGGTASRWKARSEINVRTLAAPTAAIISRPCHQDRDSFRTISETDIMRTGTHEQTLLYDGKADDGLKDWEIFESNSDVRRIS